MLADLLRLQLDIVGAHSELAASLFGENRLKTMAPACTEARPVITIPGFLASGLSLMRLNSFLRQQGFTAKHWGQGRNLGPQGMDWGHHLDAMVRQMTDHIDALADETSAPVSLVGQSLGGVYARELALRLNDRIDRVIMLGAPTFHPYKSNRHNRLIGTFGYWLNRQSATEFAGREGMLHWQPDRPDMPCVAIHSPVDGVVDEQACHIPSYIVAASSHRSPRENIRVMSSHIGMSVSPLVHLAVADRLLAERANWRAFDPMTYFPTYLRPAVRLLFPESIDMTHPNRAGVFAKAGR